MFLIMAQNYFTLQLPGRRFFQRHG